MTLTEFADQFVAENHGTHCGYIAIMPVDDQYDLEIEIDRGTIGGIYRTEESDLEKVRQMARELDSLLKQRGVSIYQTRECWENYAEN
jgi:hypothetical protein